MQLKKIHFLPYQKEYMRCSSSLVYLKSRQIGMTTASAFKHIIKRLDRKLDLYYSATDELQSKQFIERCVEICLFLDIPIQSSGLTQLVLTNGSTIYGISSSPKTIRGKSDCDIILDEFGFHDDGEALLEAATPVMTWGGCLEIISTQSPPSHPFFSTYQDAINGKLNYKTFKTDIHEAVAQGLALEVYKRKNNITEINKTAEEIEEINKTFVDNIRASNSSLTFEVEYECAISSSGNSIVTIENYNKCTSTNNIPDYLDENKHYDNIHIGIDIGRTKDLTVLWAIEDAQDNPRTICIKELNNLPLPIQFAELNKICKHKNVYKINVDMGSIGRSISDELAMKYGSMVTPVSIGQAKKAELCERVRKYVEQKRITLPDNKRIKDDICSMKLNYTPNGTAQYVGGTDFSHADYFIALALALQSIPEYNRINFSVGKMK